MFIRKKLYRLVVSDARLSGGKHGVRTPLQRNFYGTLAQLVEQRIEDPRVGGSTPSRPTIV